MRFFKRERAKPTLTTKILNSEKKYRKRKLGERVQKHLHITRSKTFFFLKEYMWYFQDSLNSHELLLGVSVNQILWHSKTTPTSVHLFRYNSYNKCLSSWLLVSVCSPHCPLWNYSVSTHPCNACSPTSIRLSPQNTCFSARKIRVLLRPIKTQRPVKANRFETEVCPWQTH